MDFDEIRDHEIAERRRTMAYALIILFAIVVTIGAIVLTYGGFV